MDEFWTVMNHETGLADTDRYNSADEAKKKALHYAQEKPGERYIVLHAIGEASLSEPVPVWKDAEPYIPF